MPLTVIGGIEMTTVVVDVTKIAVGAPCREVVLTVPYSNEVV
jgi:hypothetical protein